MYIHSKKSHGRYKIPSFEELKQTVGSHYREVNTRSSLFTENYVYLPGALFVIVMVWVTQAELPVNNPW